MTTIAGANAAPTFILSTEHAPHVLLELTEITVPPHVQINIKEKTVVSNVIVDLMKSVTLYTAVEVLPLHPLAKQQLNHTSTRRKLHYPPLKCQILLYGVQFQLI
uniref:Uncharacterized protein n=1 Tax=Magallana gigas TaxID=29159 RepID=A0A8W8L5Q4_MAGGI